MRLSKYNKHKYVLKRFFVETTKLLFIGSATFLKPNAIAASPTVGKAFFSK